MARQEVEYHKGNMQVKADAYVLGTVGVAGNQTATITLNDDIDNYSYLIGQGLTGATILGEMYIPIGSIKGGSAYRIGYSDTSYEYWWDMTYISDTQIRVKATYPASATLTARVLGIKEYITI